MLNRKLAGSLSMLCALLFCALAAQSALAVEAVNTTAYTCVKNANGDFTDAHCDEKVEPGLGNFAHVSIASETETEIEVTNQATKNKTTESTPFTFKWNFGLGIIVECATVSTDPLVKSFIRNTGSGSSHKLDGTVAVIFEKCTVVNPPGCIVKSITFASKFVGVEATGPNKDTMGLEFQPDGKSKPFITVPLEKCSFMAPIEVEGTAIATGTPSPKGKYSGATAIFTNEMTKETLSFANRTVEISAAFTLKMAKENPISLTTIT